MKNVCLIIGLLFVGTMSYGQSGSYDDKLGELFKLSGTEESFKAAITQTMNMFKSQYTDVPVEIWTRLEGRFLEASLGDLTTMLVPVYQKYLTESDLDEIINFYQTPVGKKYAMNTPMIMQESMQIGQEWGMKIGEELAKELAEEGY